MNPDQTTLRAAIDERIAAGDASGAGAHLKELWRAAANPALAGYVLSRYEKLAGLCGRTPLRLALLRSFTVEPIVPLLRAGAAVEGLDLQVQLGEFNAYVQEILDAGSALYAFQPQVVLLAVRTEDVAPELWRDFADLAAADVDAAIERVTGAYAGWLEALRSRTGATVLVHNLEVPAWPSQGILDGQVATSQAAAIRRVNAGVAAHAARLPGVHVIDWDGLLARHGRLGFHDARRWLSVRMPIPADRLLTVAEEWLRFVCAAGGRAAKCLVCDLDNTLWGGIIGEDGIDGIQLGVEYPGAAYVALQRTILDLYQRGVILALCSKNNRADAMQAIAEHPHMLLRPVHFAATRIDWNDKAENLRQIAAELNIGLDALAFIDDSAVECQNVMQRLPEVRVLHLSGDPMDHAGTLRRQPWFERLALTEEDRLRGQLYASERQRADLQQSATGIEDFYRSLEMKVEFVELSPATLTRVSQLTQKTNQFNLTTRRYSEPEVNAFASSDAHRVFAARVLDRFGDNGIVGVVIVAIEGGVWTLDTFLMSCRVIGRTVETSILAWVVEQARASGASAIEGEFLPTRKNPPAADFYARHGFGQMAGGEAGSRWRLDLVGGTVAPPPWIELVATAAR